MPSPVATRVIAGTALLAGGAISLPLSALFLDASPVGERFILPAQLTLMAGTGAALGAVLPKIAGNGASHGRGAIVGAIAGVTAAAIADVMWWKLISG